MDEQGKNKELLFRYEDMIRKNTRYFFDIEEFESIIDYYIENNRPNSAMRAIEIAFTQHPNANELQIKQVQVLINTGKKTEAFGILKRLEKIDENNPDIYLLKGMIFVSQDNMAEAIKSFDHAIEIGHNERTDFLLSAAMSFENAGKYNIALEYLLKAYNENNSNKVILYELAYCYERLSDFAKSIDFYKLYIDEDPYSATAWYNLGVIYNIIENYDDAIDAYDYAIAIDEDFASAYFNKANSLANKNDFTGAIEAYKEFIEKDDDNLVAYYYIGECYEKMGDYDTSIDYYKKALSGDSNFADAWMGLACIDYQKDNFDDCIENVKKALEIEPENPDYLLLYANALTEKEQYDEAREAFKMAAMKEPGDEEILVCWSDMEFASGDVATAISVLLNAYTYLEESALANFRLAAYYAITSDKDKMLHYIGISLKLDSSQIEEFYDVIASAKIDDDINSIIDNLEK